MVQKETYVLDDTEVQKTGRTAERALRSGKVDVLVEVTPVSKQVGSWHRWVRDRDLFTVIPGGDA